MSLPSSGGEGQSLLSFVSITVLSKFYPQSGLRHQLLRNVCLSSMPVILFIYLAVVVGAVQKIFSMCGAIFFCTWWLLCQ